MSQTLSNMIIIWMLISLHQVIIPGSNLFRVDYLDGGTLRQDTWYSWRRRGEQVARWKDYFDNSFWNSIIQVRNGSANVEAGQRWQLGNHPRGPRLLRSLRGRQESCWNCSHKKSLNYKFGQFEVYWLNYLKYLGCVDTPSAYLQNDNNNKNQEGPSNTYFGQKLSSSIYPTC